MKDIITSFLVCIGTFTLACLIVQYLARDDDRYRATVKMPNGSITELNLTSLSVSSGVATAKAESGEEYIFSVGNAVIIREARK